MISNNPSPDYSVYETTKKDAYFRNVAIYKWVIHYLPIWLLKRVFPVIYFLDIPRGSVVLDIGSGAGLYSHVLRQRFGCRCTEVEPYLNNLYGAQQHVLKCDISTMPFDTRYDVILLIDVVEHLQLGTTSELLGRLKLMTHSGSLIYMKVPNVGSIAGLESSFGDLTHMQHLNAISLTTLAVNNGYSVRRIGGIGPNLSPKRMLLRLLSLPFEALLWAHLKAHGCSGVLTKPSIMIELKKCA